MSWRSTCLFTLSICRLLLVASCQMSNSTMSRLLTLFISSTHHCLPLLIALSTLFLSSFLCFGFCGHSTSVMRVYKPRHPIVWVFSATSWNFSTICPDTTIACKNYIPSKGWFTTRCALCGLMKSVPTKL